MKLYFIRHGESTANLQRVFSNNGDCHPLTELGIKQALTTARSLRGILIDRIYSSPVLRALQTAHILSDELEGPLEVTEALREWNVGIYEGTTEPLGWELHHQVQEDWFFHRKLDSKMPGGESFLEIQERFVPFIQELLHVPGHSHKNIILVGHGGLYIAMLPVIFINVDHEFAIHHGFSYTATVEAESRAVGLYCTSWCGIKFNDS